MKKLPENWKIGFFGLLTLLSFTEFAWSQSNFRILPYLQIADGNLVQLRWFSKAGFSSSIVIKDLDGKVLFTSDIQAEEQSNLYYTTLEKNQSIAGLEGQNWIGGEKYYRYNYKFKAPFNQTLKYEVILGMEKYAGQFKTGPDPGNWEKIRFIALADSETEPKGRVTHRAWYPGNPLIRPFATPELWKQKFGTTTEAGFEIPNYFLSEKKGFAENLKIIKERNPDFVVMPGDLVQGGGYMPGWDEFWRHTAGEFDQIFTKIPIIPALGNWESFGALNGGYGINERGVFNPVLSRSRFHTFFELDFGDPLQKHRQSYYRTDYGPVTILTLDSTNGTPEEKRSDTPEEQKLKGKEYNGPGTDTQENFTLAEYQAAGGTDLSGFGPGTDQYKWLEENLKAAKEEKRLVFVQFHHIPFASGEHGVPMNHELSTGQGGTPLRVLHPLFEEYGVIAVLSGHDELFERSLVDLDGDGKGVFYYDVGLAGEGMRGVKRDWLNDPTAPLDYNPYSKWTADLKEPEQWNTSGPVPILIDGGKHYGHLEVNLTKIKDGNKYFAQIDFDPVYVFPVLNSNYELEKVERRIYNDRVRIFVELSEEVVAPVFKEKIVVELNPNGIAHTTLKDYLVNEPKEDWKVEYSQSTTYSCTQLEGTEIEIQITDAQGNSWKKVVLVEVKDKLAPVLVTKSPSLVFDKTIGFLELDPEQFVSSVSDNCGIKSIELNKSRITCGEFDLPQELILTVTDQAGNITFKVIEVFVSTTESKKVSLKASGILYPGGSINLTLGEELNYEVIHWTRNSSVIPNQKNKILAVTQGGNYQAYLRLEPGCTVYSLDLEVSLSELPFPPVKERIELNLNEEGIAELSPSKLFSDWPITNTDLTFEFSQKLFDCSNLGEKEITVLIKDSKGQSWERKVVVLIRDSINPMIIPRNIQVQLDVTIGKVEISPEQVLESVKDNCTLKSVTISKNSFTCEDMGKEISVTIRAEDQSGNVSEKISKVTVQRKESQAIQISGKKEICQGEKTILELSSPSAFEVVRWRRNGVEIPNQTGKTLETGEPGMYHAVIRYQGGCLSETQDIEVKVNAKPSGEIRIDGNVLVAPQGEFTYQWFRNGSKIENATNRTLTLSQMGEYSVELTSSAGCKSQLPAVTMTIAGLGGKWVKNPENLKIFPNPATSRATVELPIDKLGAGKIQFSVFDMEGREVSSSLSILQTKENTLELQLKELPRGTYLIWVTGSSQISFMGKLVIL
jgi:3',5'-cyclic AMP phosphodiesterase CpdA